MNLLFSAPVFAQASIFKPATSIPVVFNITCVALEEKADISSRECRSALASPLISALPSMTPSAVPENCCTSKPWPVPISLFVYDFKFILNLTKSGSSCKFVSLGIASTTSNLERGSTLGSISTVFVTPIKFVPKTRSCCSGKSIMSNAPKSP